MGESIGPASGLSCKMPFIVSSNIDRVDPATRKLIRRHVMRGKKRKKADRPGAAGLVSADSIQNHRATRSTGYVHTPAAWLLRYTSILRRLSQQDGTLNSLEHGTRCVAYRLCYQLR